MGREGWAIDQAAGQASARTIAIMYRLVIGAPLLCWNLGAAGL